MYRLTSYYLCAMAGTAMLFGQTTPAKQYKDPAEFEAFNAVVKDMAVSNFTQEMADLDA